MRVRCVVPKPARRAGRLCGLRVRSCLRTEVTDTGVVGHTGERERARRRCALRVLASAVCSASAASNERGPSLCSNSVISSVNCLIGTSLIDWKRPSRVTIRKRD